MKENTKKQYLIKIISRLLEANIDLMSYYKALASDDESKKTCAKSIRKSRLALEKIKKVNHIEILQSLYNTLISGKENIFVLAGSLICSKQFYYWDNTKNGFKEFMELENKAKEEQKTKLEEQRKERESIAKAKAEGKKVEMVYDPKTKKLKPSIIEEH